MLNYYHKKMQKENDIANIRAISHLGLNLKTIGC